MSKKGCFGGYNFGDSIHAIDHTHRVATRGLNGFVYKRCFEATMFIATYGKLSEMRFYRKWGKLCVFFGKVPHSSFASCGHVCAHQYRRLHHCNYYASTFASGQKFWCTKFGDQASIHQIHQNLLSPIFSTIRYTKTDEKNRMMEKERRAARRW